MGINTDKVIGRLELYAPEHESKSDKLKKRAIEAAVDQRINVTAWAKAGKLVDGAAYLAAHILSVREQSQQTANNVQGAGPVDMVSEGDLTISWAVPDDAGSGSGEQGGDLADTKYGRAFKDLEDALPSTPTTSG